MDGEDVSFMKIGDFEVDGKVEVEEDFGRGDEGRGCLFICAGFMVFG